MNRRLSSPPLSIRQCLQGLTQRHDPQAPPSLQRRRSAHLDLRRRPVHHRRARQVVPLSEHALEVARNTLQHHRRDGHKRPVLHSGRQDGILLRKVEGVVERRVLVLGTRAHDDVELKEGVQDVNIGREQIRLLERPKLNDLPPLLAPSTRLATPGEENSPAARRLRWSKTAARSIDRSSASAASGPPSVPWTRR